MIILSSKRIAFCVSGLQQWLGNPDSVPDINNAFVPLTAFRSLTTARHSRKRFCSRN